MLVLCRAKVRKYFGILKKEVTKVGCFIILLYLCHRIMFLIGNIIGSVFWGLIITIVVVGGVFLLCKALVSYRASSLLSLGILLVLFVLAGAQSTMMVGAMYAKGYVDDISTYANSLVTAGADAVQSGTDAVPSVSDFNRIRQQIEDQFPMAKPVLDRIDVGDLDQYVASGHSVVDFIANELKSTLNYYILRRVLWLMGFVLVALVGILLLNRPRDYTLDMNSLDSIY